MNQTAKDTNIIKKQKNANRERFTIRLDKWELTQSYLIAGPAFEAVRVKFIDMENMYGALDAEVMQLTGDFKE